MMRRHKTFSHHDPGHGQIALCMEGTSRYSQHSEHPLTHGEFSFSFHSAGSYDALHNQDVLPDTS